nr:hypothetical protein [Halalkalicoccus paucihalophilus]
MMFYQATAEFYGESLSAYQITDLTPETFEQDRNPASPLLEGTAEEENEDPAWNSLRMHHYDPWYRGEGGGWRAAVDGDARGMDGPKERRVILPEESEIPGETTLETNAPETADVGGE